MTSLRTIWGCDLNQFKIENLKFKILESLKGIDVSLYILEEDVLKLTQKGKHYADRIASDLFIED